MSAVLEPSDGQIARLPDGYGWDDPRWLTVIAMRSAFLPFDERLALVDVVEPGFATPASD